MICRIGAVVLTTIFLLAPVASNAQPADIILEKKTFEMRATIRWREPLSNR
jgi:hypothetical protein